MSAAVTAWLRTVIPAVWGAVVAWLVGRGLLPDALSGTAETVAETLLVPAAIALVYAGARWLEARLPGWLHRLLPDRAAGLVAALLTRVLLGSTLTPTYDTRTAAPRLLIEPGALTQEQAERLRADFDRALRDRGHWS